MNELTLLNVNTCIKATVKAHWFDSVSLQMVDQDLVTFSHLEHKI